MAAPITVADVANGRKVRPRGATIRLSKHEASTMRLPLYPHIDPAMTLIASRASWGQQTWERGWWRGVESFFLFCRVWSLIGVRDMIFWHWHNLYICTVVGILIKTKWKSNFRNLCTDWFNINRNIRVRSHKTHFRQISTYTKVWGHCSKKPMTYCFQKS